MLVSLRWLQDYVAITLPPAELARRLTEAGLPVEGIEQKGADTVLNVEVTSNRPDCLGHIGVAREIAALTGQSVRLPATDVPETAGPIAERFGSVTVTAPDLCPRYTARVATEVKVGPSPDWMRERLEAIGLRSISNVVDITNYVLMECGQPLHAFDLDKLSGRQIVVRRARAGEAITAINGTKLEMSPAALGLSAGELPLVIADAARPVAVAGVMGGAESEVGPATRNVLLESAEFEMLAIRRSARKLQLDSDSSYRFERGVDPTGVEWASRRAARLLAELAGAKIAAGAMTVAKEEYAAPTVTLRIARIPAVLGMAISADEARRTLERLGFPIVSADDKAVTVRIPGYRRRDVSREIDLIEEVARIHGYADLPDADMPVMVSARSPRTVLEGSVGEALQAAGYYEVITKSLVDKTLVDLAADGAAAAEALQIDPGKTAFHHLRRSLLPSLLSVRKNNQHAGIDSASLYEIAHAFLPRGGGLPEEPTRLAMLTDGESEEDWRRFRGALESAFAAAGAAGEAEFAPAPAPGFDPAVSLEVRVGGKPIGHAGRCSRAVQQARQFDLRRPVMMAEVDLGVLCAAERPAGRFRALPKFPSVVRDLNVVVASDLLWRQIEASVRGTGIPELESLQYLSTYSKGLPAGKKSITFSMTFRSPTDTLTGEAANGFHARVLDRLKKEFGAELRG